MENVQILFASIGMAFTAATFIIALIVRAEVSKQIKEFGDSINHRLETAERARERIFQRLETLEDGYRQLHVSDERLWQEIRSIRDFIIGARGTK